MQTLNEEKLQQVSGAAFVLPADFRRELAALDIGVFRFSPITSGVGAITNSFSGPGPIVAGNAGGIPSREYC